MVSSKKRKITRKSAKAKGRRWQQWCAKQISKITDIPWGKDELIRSREASQSGVDVVLLEKAQQLFPFAIEVKAQEKLSLYSWIKQAKSNTPEYLNWLLVHKKNHEDPIVVMDGATFFKFFGELIKLRKDDKI